MADENEMRCVYHLGNRATFTIPPEGYYIRGKVEHVALCPICVRKLGKKQLGPVPHHFMPQHRLQEVDYRIVIRDGS